MAKKIRVGVIFGGRSVEHEVSLVSATSIIKALDKNRYEVFPIGITKEGKWIASGDSLQLLKDAKTDTADFAMLPADPSHNQLINLNEDYSTPPEAQKKLDVIFPVLHGTFGEDGTMQGFLELTGIPYVGCGVLASAVGMDKAVQKALFIQAGLPVVNYQVVEKHDWLKNKTSIVKKITESLKLPFFVKPANLGSSVGISKVHQVGELEEAIKDAFQYDRKILIEEGVQPARELECSVLGNEKVEASVVGEIIPSNEFYDYEAKYVDGKSKSVIPAAIDKKISDQVREVAIKAFRAIDGAGMARVDFFCNEKLNKIFLNEVNTIPGFTSISMYPKLWEASGLNYPDLVDKLISLAIERHEQNKTLLRSIQPKKDWYKK